LVEENREGDGVFSVVWRVSVKEDDKNNQHAF
jgi:hypothetical protein